MGEVIPIEEWRAGAAERGKLRMTQAYAEAQAAARAKLEKERGAVTDWMAKIRAQLALVPTWVWVAGGGILVGIFATWRRSR